MEPTPIIQNQNNYQPQKPKHTGLWTFLIIVILIIIVGILYFATSASFKKQGASVADIPLNSGAGTSQVLGGTATVTGLSLVTLETFPYQEQANVNLSLSDTCSTATPNVIQSGSTYDITFTTTKPANAVCTDTATPSQLTVNLPVVNIPAGTYTVNAGTYSQTFTFAMDNQIEYNSPK